MSWRRRPIGAGGGGGGDGGGGGGGGPIGRPFSMWSVRFIHARLPVGGGEWISLIPFLSRLPSPLLVPARRFLGAGAGRFTVSKNLPRLASFSPSLSP